jgi:hypothetical protein
MTREHDRWRHPIAVLAVVSLALAVAVGIVIAAETLPDLAHRPTAWVSREALRRADVTVRGTVDVVNRDLLGCPSRVAIVFPARGVLVETAVEDEGAGAALKDQMGDYVTAVGVLMVKADGTTSLVVAQFEVEPAGP